MEIPNIPNKVPVLYVMFTAAINPYTAQVLMTTLAQAAKKRVPKVYLALSTTGGQVQSGIALYTALRALPFELIIHNTSSVNSIGNVVFLAGDTRYAVPYSTFMFHGVGFDVPAGVRIEEQMARDRLDSILADQERMGDIIADRTSLETGQVAGLFAVQKTKSADWAKDNGVIHDIMSLDIPEGSHVLSFVFDGKVTK